jgi:hypothetical protein
MPHMSLAGICLIIIAGTSLILAGYIPGWLRGRSVGRAELAMETDSFWGPEAEDSSWEPEASATTAMPVIHDAPTATIPVPNITEMPRADSTVRFQRVPVTERRVVSDREWLDRQASLADLVRPMAMVNGRVVSGIPDGTMVCDVTATAPQPVLDPDTQAFLDEMDRRTTQIIQKFREPVPIPG